MSGILVLLEVVLIFGGLGAFAYFATKKVKQNQSQLAGINGKVHIADSMSLSMDSKLYIIETEGEKFMLVTTSNGVEMTKLRSKGFEEMMKGELE